MRVTMPEIHGAQSHVLASMVNKAKVSVSGQICPNHTTNGRIRHKIGKMTERE